MQTARSSRKRSRDPVRLQHALDNVHRAGVPGLFAEVRDGDQVWASASGYRAAMSGESAGPIHR